MPLTKAQCTNCGAILDVDSSKDAAICPSCGTAYIIEKAINNYNINCGGTQNQETYLERGITQLKLGRYNDASETFSLMSKKYPSNWKAWLGLALSDCCINKKHKLEIDGSLLTCFPTSIIDSINNADIFLPDTIKAKYQKEIDWLDQQNNRTENAFEADEARENAEKNIASSEATLNELSKESKTSSLFGLVFLIGSIILYSTGHTFWMIICGFCALLSFYGAYSAYRGDYLKGSNRKMQKEHLESAKKQLEAAKKMQQGVEQRRQDNYNKKAELIRQCDEELKNPNNTPDLDYFISILKC